MLRVLNKALGDPLEAEERAALPLAGGLMQYGYQCGMIWGSTLAAGARAYHLLGPGPQAETRAIMAAQRIVESFRAQHNEINCFEITNIDRSSTTWEMIMFFLIKGGAIGCFRKASKYAPLGFNAIDSAFSQENIEAPASPVSCAALLARKMGASDLHTTMVSGFAGGIGLCGGACGALGAALWHTTMESAKEQGGDRKLGERRGADLIDRFIKCTDFKFECSEIVGRIFEGVDDHAGYLRDGGCSKIIEVLATK